MAHFLSRTTPPILREKLLLNLPICYRTRFNWKSESFRWFKVLHIYENWQNYKMPFKQCRKHNKTTLHPEAQNYPATCHQHLGDSSATAPTFSALLWAWSNPCPWDHVPGGLVSFSHSFHTCAVPVVAANLHQTALSSSLPTLLVRLVAGLTDLMVKSLWLLPSPQTSDEFPCHHAQPPSGILKGQMPSHTEKAGLGLGEEKRGTSLPSLSHLHNHAKPAFSQPFQQSQEVIYSCPIQQLRTTSICSRICFHMCMQKKKSQPVR